MLLSLFEPAAAKDAAAATPASCDRVVEVPDLYLKKLADRFRGSGTMEIGTITDYDANAQRYTACFKDDRRNVDGYEAGDEASGKHYTLKQAMDCMERYERLAYTALKDKIEADAVEEKAKKAAAVRKAIGRKTRQRRKEVVSMFAGCNHAEGWTGGGEECEIVSVQSAIGHGDKSTVTVELRDGTRETVW